MNDDGRFSARSSSRDERRRGPESWSGQVTASGVDFSSTCLENVPPVMSTPIGVVSDDAQVSLVFPPLVTEGLGRYYPSTAVLAGYLASRGVRTSQANLNEVFALEILETKQLESIGDGVLPDGSSVDRTELPAVGSVRSTSTQLQLLFQPLRCRLP